jgi:hypothetical protein
MSAPTPGFPDDVPCSDLHWLAGLLEGEGSFLKGPPSAPRHPILALQMTDEDVVARVAAMSDARPAAAAIRQQCARGRRALRRERVVHLRPALRPHA